MTNSPDPRQGRSGRPAMPPRRSGPSPSPSPSKQTMPLPRQPRPPIVVQRPDYQSSPPPEPEPPRRKRRAVSLWILGVVIMVVAALWISALGFVRPGWFVRTVFDPRGVQLGVQQVLRDSYHVNGVESVTCPPGEPVRPAITFACTVRIGDQTQTVAIAVRDATGTYWVGRPR